VRPSPPAQPRARTTQVANRHPYSDFNRERLGGFYEQRPREFSTQFGYGFPVKVFDRNSKVQQRGGDAPFPPGYVGHVPEKSSGVGETFGRITKAKVDSNMALRPTSPIWQSTMQKCVCASVTPPLKHAGTLPSTTRSEHLESARRSSSALCLLL
jgi:hypothetical protein